MGRGYTGFFRLVGRSGSRRRTRLPDPAPKAPLPAPLPGLNSRPQTGNNRPNPWTDVAEEAARARSVPLPRQATAKDSVFADSPVGPGGTVAPRGDSAATPGSYGSTPLGEVALPHRADDGGFTPAPPNPEGAAAAPGPRGVPRQRPQWAVAEEGARALEHARGSVSGVRERTGLYA